MAWGSIGVHDCLFDSLQGIIRLVICILHELVYIDMDYTTRSPIEFLYFWYMMPVQRHAGFLASTESTLAVRVWTDQAWGMKGFEILNRNRWVWISQRASSLRPSELLLILAASLAMRPSCRCP